LLVVFGYAFGTIPTGVLLARRAGVDVRRAGSGNVGAANVARTVGLVSGLVTLVGDAAKGAVPPLLAHWLGASPALAAAAGLAAVVGHVFPVTSRFAGGKGVATAFVAVVGATRYVSLASLAGALGALPAAAVGGYPPPVLVVTTAMAGLILARHADNLRRLAAGTEPRFVPRTMRKKQATPGN